MVGHSGSYIRQNPLSSGQVQIVYPAGASDHSSKPEEGDSKGSSHNTLRSVKQRCRLDFAKWSSVQKECFITCFASGHNFPELQSCTIYHHSCQDGVRRSRKSQNLRI